MEKATSRPTCPPLLSFFASIQEPIAFPFCGLKYFHEEEEEKEEEISLFTGKIESPREEIILTRDYVPRTRILTLNKFLPSRNSIVYFSPFEGNRLENEKSEICRAYCGRRTDSFETIYKNYRFDRWKEYRRGKRYFYVSSLNRIYDFKRRVFIYMCVKARLVYSSNSHE